MSETRSRSGSVCQWDANENLTCEIDKNNLFVKPSAPSTATYKGVAAKISIKGCLIDSPLVAPSSIASNFLFHFPPSTTFLRIPEHWYSNAEINEKSLSNSRRPSYRRLSCLDSSDEPLLNSSLSDISEWTEIDIPNTTSSDLALQIIKNKIKQSKAGENVQLEGEGGNIFNLKQRSQKLTDQLQEKKVKVGWMQLRKITRQIFEWNLNELQQFQKRQDEMERNVKLAFGKPQASISKPPDKEYVKKTTISLYRQLNDVENFHAARRLHGENSWPDICKFFAFMAWTKKDLQKCAYYLSESHGTFWKVETIDKHNLTFSRAEEAAFNFGTKGSGSRTEQQKQKVHLLQSKVLREFGTSLPNFQTQVNKTFQHFWNVIQITTDVHTSNRFGKELSDCKEIPGVWITCFNALRSGEVRSTTHYVPKSKGNIWEENFTRLISDNKTVSEGCIADRKLYWQTRSKHNNQLRHFLETIEDWLAPYIFLFPGHSKTTELRNKYWRAVDKIEKICGKPLSDSMSIILFKLIENYKFFPRDKIHLSVFLQTSLSVNLEVAKQVEDFLRTMDFSAPPKGTIQRHETIIILDAELERYPLDWLPVFQQSLTPVNRMFSMAHIYATVEVSKKFIENYPMFVQPKKGTYIINPDKSLENVQQRLQGYFGARDWNGVCGRNPSHPEFEEALQKRDVLVYCGHGSGGSMYPEWALSRLLCRTVPILMGCSSSQTKFVAPKCYHSSAIHSYFSAVCPSIVGFLWEITDVECDRVTIDLLERWLPCSKGIAMIPPIPNFDLNKKRQKERSLSCSVMKSRHAATQFMTAASIVVYGLPVYTILDSETNIS